MWHWQVVYALDNIVRVQLDVTNGLDGIANSTWVCPAVFAGAATYNNAACVRTPAAVVAGATLVGSTIYFKLSQVVSFTGLLASPANKPLHP